MKKIISLLATVAIMASTFVSFGTVASAVAGEGTAENITIHVDVQSPEDYAGTLADVPTKDGYDTYLVSYSISGVDGYQYQLWGLTVAYDISDEDFANIEASTFKQPVTSGPPVMQAKNGLYSFIKAPSTLSRYQFAITELNAAGMADPFEGTDYTVSAQSKNIITTIWYVKNDTSVTIDYLVTASGNDSLVTTVPYGDNSKPNGYWYDNLSYDVESITLGESAPTDVPATGVEITGAPAAAVEIGYATTLGATVTPDEATDKTVTWSSSAPTIVSVNAETGAIEALAAGEAVITATCGTVSDTVTITVNEPAPAAFDFVVGTCKAIDAGTKKGFVWVANKMLNVNTAEKTYTAVFSTADDEKSVALDLTAAVEAPEATIVFDAVLTTNKLNVNFNVIEN